MGEKQDDWKLKLNSNLVYILKSVNSSSSALLEHLRQNNVLTDLDVDELKVHRVTYHRNTALIDILKKRPDDDYYKFLKALNDTNQEHIVKKIEGPDTSKLLLDPKYPNDGPNHGNAFGCQEGAQANTANLNKFARNTDTFRATGVSHIMAQHTLEMGDPQEEWKQKLQDNLVYLVENMDIGMLRIHLIQNKVLSTYQANKLQTYGVDVNRNEALIMFLQQRDENCYYKFLRALIDTNQENIACRIEKTVLKWPLSPKYPRGSDDPFLNRRSDGTAPVILEETQANTANLSLGSPSNKDLKELLMITGERAMYIRLNTAKLHMTNAIIVFNKVLRELKRPVRYGPDRWKEEGFVDYIYELVRIDKPNLLSEGFKIEVVNAYRNGMEALSHNNDSHNYFESLKIVLFCMVYIHPDSWIDLWENYLTTWNGLTTWKETKISKISLHYHYRLLGELYILRYVGDRMYFGL